jgi:hypothetical protein
MGGKEMKNCPQGDRKKREMEVEREGRVIRE